MQSEILNIEKDIINTNIQDIEIKLSVLRSRLNKIDSSTSFSDDLNRSFYGGRVGYLSKKDNAKKDKELNKTIQTAKESISINEEITTLEKRLKKLKTGRYLMRSNGLIVESYSFLSEQINSIDAMLKTRTIKGRTASNEELSILKDMRKEYKKKLNSRSKLYKAA